MVAPTKSAGGTFRLPNPLTIFGIFVPNGFAYGSVEITTPVVGPGSGAVEMETSPLADPKAKKTTPTSSQARGEKRIKCIKLSQMDVKNAPGRGLSTRIVLRRRSLAQQS